VKIVKLFEDCGIYEPIEIAKFKITKGKHGRYRTSSPFYAEVFVRKAKHPMLADGWTLKVGGKGDFIPVSFNIDALIKIFRYEIVAMAMQK
jgi:hypothetical protein